MAVTLEVVFRVVKTLCQRRHSDHMTQRVNSLLAHPWESSGNPLGKSSR